jgi:NitT/TauT family transport system substrate-binding protein
MKPQLSRRAFTQHIVSMGVVGPFVYGCVPAKSDPLRIGAQPWPGYELIYLARELNLYNGNEINLIEAPSASANLRGLATRSLDGACLTLDEVLTARSNGVDLTIVAVLDESRGADVLIARQDIPDLKSLKGKTVGVEQTATGAVLLNAALDAAGLSANDIQTIYIPIENHLSHFLDGKLDAIVTYEPTKSKLLAKKTHAIFSSASIPGRILDTIAIRSEVIPKKSSELKSLVHSHFQARSEWKNNPAKNAPKMAGRLDLAAADVPAAFSEIHLPDAQENLAWMTGNPAKLTANAQFLGELMARQGLLRNPPSLKNLFSPDFLP